MLLAADNGLMGREAGLAKVEFQGAGISHHSPLVKAGQIFELKSVITILLRAMVHTIAILTAVARIIAFRNHCSYFFSKFTHIFKSPKASS